MARPVHPVTGGTHIILSAENAALLRQLAIEQQASLKDTFTRALRTYAAISGAQK